MLATWNKPMTHLAPSRRPRRQFLRDAALVAGGGVLVGCHSLRSPTPVSREPASGVALLPKGAAPAPVSFPHFPTRLHAVIWRNWSLVPVERLARTVGARPGDLRRLAAAMGLPPQRPISADQQRRSFITVIRRNWHLLPYDQLLQLLDSTPEALAYTLREDDFLFVKLGNLKPECPPVRWQPSDAAARAREQEIARVIREEFPGGLRAPAEPLFGFLEPLCTPVPALRSPRPPGHVPIRFCYSYFALYGDPLLDTATDPYPDGYLSQLAAVGVNGVWLQGVLSRLAPFPWEPAQSADWEKRLENLRRLVARARHHGVGIWLYLNEPRTQPRRFFERYPDVQGVSEGDYATLCTSHPDVQRFLVESVATICRTVPDLAGFFTITASENLTNCWSHGGGAQCPRCRDRHPGAVIADVNQRIQEGLDRASTSARLIAWDWGWADAWVETAIASLPPATTLMSVSEWSLPIERGGVRTEVGEYSISAVGPGPRARRHWELARRRGLATLAKIQAGNTWELSAVPYIPAVANVARHAANLAHEGLGGLMLGWTLGGYPSPNLEVVAAVDDLVKSEGRPEDPAPLAERALQVVATRRFGKGWAESAAEAWCLCSRAFSEFPYHGGLVYNAPLQVGPANLLWETPTGYRATMVGIPYDDLEAWRAIYPADTFCGQLEKVAEGFQAALELLRRPLTAPRTPDQERAWKSEQRVVEAAGLHFRSVANQARFVMARQAATGSTTPQARSQWRVLIQEEIRLAKRLHELQSRDSRLGFEASNQYYYVPLDLVEKVLNCRHLLDRHSLGGTPAP